MSYLVLARKYRPRNFAEMVGQGHVVQALGNALSTQRLHHAYLFTGTRGVGKTTVSRILAKSLNCQGPDGQGGITASPCGVCQACTDIDAGRFVDYTELDAASNRGVDEVQALLEQAVYKPVQGRFKVFMIDEVHMLTGHAFNAMLKTLEEPPDYLKFVLATTDPQKVPVTVLSRCLQFNLRPMAPQTIFDHLEQVLAAETVSFDTPALHLLARAARGSMRDALSLSDQAIAFGGGQVSEATVRQMLGSVDRTYVFALIEALARSEGRQVVETVESLRVQGLNAASALEEMASVLHRMAVYQSMGEAQTGQSSDPQEADMARLAELLPADETQLLYSICLHGRGDLGLAPDEYAALTMVLLRLLAFKPGTASAQVQSAPGMPAAEKKSLKSAPEDARGADPGAHHVLAPTLEPALKPPLSLGAKVLPQAPQSQSSELEPANSPSAAASVTAMPSTGVSSSAHTEATASPAVQLPPGQLLAVHEQGARQGAEFDQAKGAQVSQPTPAPLQSQPTENSTTAHRVVGVPMRVQQESRLDQTQRSAVAGFVESEHGAFWHASVQALVQSQAVTALARELALQSQLIGRDEDQWILRVESESLNQAGSRDRLGQALQDAGYKVSLVVEVGRVSDSPARRNASASAERQQAAERIIHSNPMVQSWLRDFGAKIVPGSIRPL
jgi:DNA polymerase-3 subunit gamma/tau